MRRKGVSLIVLIITIVVLSILSSIVIVKVQDYSDSARIATFLNNISQIQDYIYSKNLLNEKIPLKEDTAYTINELVDSSYLNLKMKDTFEKEVISNGGDINSKFCIIDMEKLEDIENNMGYGKNGTTDYFVYEASSLKVYYLGGVYYNKKRYFSVTSEFTNISDKTSEENTSSISIDKTSKLSVKKDTTGITNKLGITISATLSENEEVMIKIGESATSKFKDKETNFKVSFNNIEELNALVTTPFNNNVIENLDEEKKYIIVSIVEGGKTVSTYNVDISNYDCTIPTITNVTTRNYSNYNLVSGKCKKNIEKNSSKIKYIRYEYEKENPDKDYMMKNSKNTYCDEEGNFSIKVPLNVSKIEIICVDNAGNISEIFEYLI